MDWLEQELKQALARKEPAGDFESRVRAATRRKNNVVMMTRRWMAAAAAAAVVMVGAGEGYRRHQGLVAKEQVMTAMRIAGGKLHRVQQQVGGRP